MFSEINCEGNKKLQIEIVPDNKSLFDALHSIECIEQKVRTKIGSLEEMLQNICLQF